jgi:hypothetical protein
VLDLSGDLEAMKRQSVARCNPRSRIWSDEHQVNPNAAQQDNTMQRDKAVDLNNNSSNPLGLDSMTTSACELAGLQGWRPKIPCTIYR